MLAAGMTFVILTGGIDLSVGSILAASAMAGAARSPCARLGLLGIPRHCSPAWSSASSTAR